MDELKKDMRELGPHPKCCEGAQNSEQFFRRLSKQLNMGERYAKYSGVLIRAVRKEKNLKNIYGNLFPEAAKLFPKADCKRKSTDQPTGRPPAAEESSEGPANEQFLYGTQPLLGQWWLPAKRSKSEPPTTWIGNATRF
jgi:hypothetical protein